MSMKNAQFIEACIPDSLRLAKHQDAELVNQAIATALLAYREADRAHVWEKSKTAAISRALSAYMESVYVPHISKEEEDWSALQKQAEEARVMKAAQAEIASNTEQDNPFKTAIKRWESVSSWADYDATDEETKALYKSLPNSEASEFRAARRTAMDRIEANPNYVGSDITEEQATSLLAKAGLDINSARVEGGSVDIGNDASIKFRSVPNQTGGITWIYTYVSRA